MYKDAHPLMARCKESKRILAKYPHRVPVICEKSAQAARLPTIDKIKFLLPWDYTVTQMLIVIRQRLQLNTGESIFLFLGNGIMVSPQSTISDLYMNYKDEDGFLYVQYAKENVFG